MDGIVQSHSCVVVVHDEYQLLGLYLAVMAALLVA